MARLAALATIVLAFGGSAGAGGRPPAAPGLHDCTPAEAHRVAARFVHAFDHGEFGLLDRLFAADDGDGDAGTPSFQWYSTGAPGPRFGRAADDRSTLISYVRARHRQGEWLKLVWMSRGGASNGYFDFGFHVHRQARDLRRPGTFLGKGAAICSDHGAQLAVWSVGPRL
jgi:hypothetical protein